MEATAAATVRPGDTILNYRGGHWVTSTVVDAYRDGEWVIIRLDERLRSILELRYDRAVRVRRGATV